MIKIFNFLNNLFIEECLNCGKNGSLICEICLNNLEKSKLKSKIIVPTLSYSQLIDYKNTEYLSNIDWISSPYSFQNPILKKALFYLKYHHVKTVAKYLAVITYQDFYNFLKIHIQNFPKNIQEIILLPVPISKQRLIKRNYNQSEILIKEIIKMIQINYNLDLDKNIYTDLLFRNKNTIPFSETHNQETRLKLIAEAFSINSKYPKEFFEDKIIIIFDDITTTGATFYEARKTLFEAGIKNENIFAFAIAH